MRCRKLISLILFLTILTVSPEICLAKERIAGHAYTSDGEPAVGVIVRVYCNDKVKGFSTTKADGSFSISVEELTDSAKLRFLSKKFATLDYPLTIPPKPVEVKLEHKDFELQEVTVRAPSRRIKGDTIEYNVSALTKAGDRNIEDVIRKIPGIEVSGDGSITYDGVSLNHFYIEDLDLMGKNYAVATRSISPDDIYSVSVYERHQDKKVLQGKEDSNKASLNLKLKKGRMLKPIGYVSGGAGYGDDVLWKGDLYGMLISPANQTIISAKGNNEGMTYGKNSDTGKYRVFTQTPFGSPRIDKSRYIDNRSMSFSANTLFRFSKDFLFRVNASYDKDNVHFNGRSVTEYLNPGKESVIYSEEVGNRLNYQSVDVSAKVEGNKDKFYFSDNFNFKGNFDRNHYNVVHSNEIHQNVRTDNFRFSNNLETILETGRRLLRINSETYFNNAPGAVMTAMNLNDGEPVVSQSVGSQTFHNREYTSLEWSLPRNMSFGSAISFEIDHDRFDSYGTKDDDKETTSNDLSGYRIDTELNPFFKIRKIGATFTLTIPVRMINLKYNDFLSGASHKNNTVLVDAKLDVMKRINRQSVVDIGIGTMGNLGDMQDFIVNPVFTTFRNSRSFGTGKLRKGRSDFIVTAYSFKNVIEDIYMNAMFNYNRTESDAIAVNDVSSTGNTSGSFLNEKNNSDIAMGQLTASKGIYKIHTTFSLKLTDVWSKGKSVRSGTAVTTKSNIFNISGKVETYQLSERLRIYANVSYRVQNVSYGGIVSSTSTNSLGFDGKISVFPVKNLEIFYAADFSRLKYGTDNYKNNSFMDAGAIYNIGKMEFGLSARNLCNQGKYAYTLYHSLDNAFYSYGLRPFEVMMSFKWKF